MKLVLHLLCVIIVAAAVTTLPCVNINSPVAMSACAKLSSFGWLKLFGVTAFLWFLFMQVGRLAKE